MTTIREGIVEYLALRRSLGFTLRGVEWMLGHFVRYVELEGAELITTDLAMRWARLPAHSQAATWSARLSAVRQFAAWWSATEPRTEVPPLGHLPGRYRRQVPYIYSDAEIGHARYGPHEEGSQSLADEGPPEIPLISRNVTCGWRPE